MAIFQPHIAANKHGNPQRLGCEHGVQRIHACVSMHPENVEGRLAFASAQTIDRMP